MILVHVPKKFEDWIGIFVRFIFLGVSVVCFNFALSVMDSPFLLLNEGSVCNGISFYQ